MNTLPLDDENAKTFDWKVEELASPVSKAVCWLVILVSLVFISTLSVAGLLIGLILLVVSILFINAKKRIILDFNNSQYKEYTSVLGMKNGEWKKMIQCNTITITPTSTRFSNNVAMGGAQSFSNTYSFNLNLKKDNYKKLVVANGNYKDIVNKAKLVAKILQVDIMDYSQKPAILIK